MREKKTCVGLSGEIHVHRINRFSSRRPVRASGSRCFVFAKGQGLSHSLSVRRKKPSCRSRTYNIPSFSNFCDGCVARVRSSCLLNRILEDSPRWRLHPRYIRDKSRYAAVFLYPCLPTSRRLYARNIDRVLN